MIKGKHVQEQLGYMFNLKTTATHRCKLNDTMSIIIGQYIHSNRMIDTKLRPSPRIGQFDTELLRPLGVLIIDHVNSNL